MKKTYRSLFCLLAVLLLSVSALPSASALFSKKLYYYGVVEGVSRTVEGKVRYAVGVIGMFRSVHSDEFHSAVEQVCATAAMISAALGYQSNPTG